MPIESSLPSDRCGYTWPEDHEIDDPPNRQSCCWRETVSDEHNRCIWHADPDEFKKTAEVIRATRSLSESYVQNVPSAELLDGANLSGVEVKDEVSFENVALREATLSGANLFGANLSGANLSDADLFGSDLSGANLSGANLSGANLSDANLFHANLSISDLSGASLPDAYLSDANLLGANVSDANLLRASLSDATLSDANLSGSELSSASLSDANLSHTNLSGANLTDANLSGADLREVNIEGVSITGTTTCNRLYEGYDDRGLVAKAPLSIRLQELLGDSNFRSKDWDATARAYHNLKVLFSDHGLIGKARTKHIQERHARRLESKAVDGWFSRRHSYSLASWIFTGYGVQIWNLVFWMVALFLVSTAIYVYVGTRVTIMDNIAYSVLAFTVAPPPPMPSKAGIQLVMMIETFFGTLSTVLLGYILGNREQF